MSLKPMSWFKSSLVGCLLTLLGGCTEKSGHPPIASQVPSLASQTIEIQPLGKIDQNLVACARDGLASFYKAKVVVLPAKALPKNAFLAPRQRYRADKLIAWLYRGSGSIVVGLTSADISTTKGHYKDWGVFGLGYLGKGACVVSTYRLRRGASPALLRQRLVKVVNHEVGHNLGLPHCPTKGCMMNDAEGKVSTVDQENGKLCPSCRSKIGM